MGKEKSVDESWKEKAFEDKGPSADSASGQASGEGIIIGGPSDKSSGEPDQQEETPKESAEGDQSIEINFLNYVTSLGFQAMIFMGEIPNPATNKVDKNLAQAKFLIDTLAMLKEKTTGNLNDQEKSILEGSVYELQMKYVQLSQQGDPSQEGESE